MKTRRVCLTASILLFVFLSSAQADDFDAMPPQNKQNPYGQQQQYQQRQQPRRYQQQKQYQQRQQQPPAQYQQQQRQQPQQYQQPQKPFRPRNYKMAVGIQGALSISNAAEVTVGDVALTTASQTGFGFGAQFEYAFNNRYYLQPEILYLQKGASVSTGTSDFIFKFTYLEFPVLFKIKFLQKNFRLQVLAGPSLAMKMGATREIKAGGLTSSADFEGANATDFSLWVGGGAELKFTPRIRAFADLRYYYGFTNVFNENQPNSTWRNNGVVFSIGGLYGF